MTRNSLLLTASLSLLTASCSTTPTPPIVVPCPELPPPPASVMVKQEASFRSNLLNYFSAKPTEPTAGEATTGATFAPGSTWRRVM